MENKNTHPKKRVASLVLPDQVVETVYDPIHKTTQFAMYKDNQVQYADFIQVGSDEFLPLDPKNDLIDKRIVLLPSVAADYGSTEELVLEIERYIHKYVDISPAFEGLAPYYALVTWVYDRFHELPYLRVIGDFGSGKTRFLQVVGSICYKPTFTGGATTTAPIFHILNDIRGTLILDEADLRASDMTNDIVKILNMGYSRGGSVLRMKGKDFSETKAFDVFSPKIIATRETFNDKALESRFLIEEMGKGTLRKDIPRNLREDFDRESLELRNKLLMWRFRNYRKEMKYDESPIENIHPRLYQIIVPLMCLIDSEDKKNSLKEFMIKLNTELIADRGLSRESDIVYAILKYEHDTKNKEVTVGEIAEYVNTDIFDFDDKITPKKIGWYIRERLRLKPVKTRRGFVLTYTANRQKLEHLKERYGVTDTDIRGDQVNDVHNVNVVDTDTPQAPTAEEVGF